MSIFVHTYTSKPRPRLKVTTLRRVWAIAWPTNHTTALRSTEAFSAYQMLTGFGDGCIGESF